MTSDASRIVLITGSGRGIGRATALVMAQRGYDVVVQDLITENAEETAALVRNLGARAMVQVSDVTDWAAAKAVVTAVEEGFGPIAALVNNAGISSDRCPIEKVTQAMLRSSIDTHVGGTLCFTQAAISAMKARRYGRIVNISSVQALVGWADSATYNAAKGAIIAMSKGWAKEFAPWQIAVNVVAPGHTETEMTIENDSLETRAAKAKTIPLGRYGRPSEIGEAIAFLASEQASFVTGQVLSPDGGFAA